MTLYSSFADDTKPVSGIIDLQQLPVSEVLPLYEKMSGLEFVIDSRVKTVSSPITLRIVGLRTKEEVMKLMREALVKQAGIVITQLDDKRESVTFNDALPIK